MPEDQTPRREIRTVPPQNATLIPNDPHMQAGRNPKPISNEGKPQPSPPPPPAPKKSQ